MNRPTPFFTILAMMLLTAPAIGFPQKKPTVRDEISVLEQAIAKQFVATLSAKGSVKRHVTILSRDGKSSVPGTVIDFEKGLIATTADFSAGTAKSVIIRMADDSVKIGKIVLSSRPDHLVLIEAPDLGEEPATDTPKAPETGSFIAGFDAKGSLKVGTVTSGIRAENKTFSANEKQALAAHWKRLKLKVSEHRHGFPVIFETDLDVDADACGGPIFTSDGTLAGVIISRTGHHATLVIPVSQITALFQKK